MRRNAKEKDVKKEILELFARAARSIGYSDVHGKVIAALLMEGRELSLQELAKLTGYSLASISLSLDFLELFEIIRRVKKERDRKLYVKLEGDLLLALKLAVLFKAQRSISKALEELQAYKQKRETRRIASRVERELKRLQKYLEKLGKVKLP